MKITFLLKDNLSKLLDKSKKFKSIVYLLFSVFTLAKACSTSFLSL